MKRAEVIWDLVRGLHQGQQHQLQQQAGHMDAPDQSSKPISSLHRKGHPHMVPSVNGACHCSGAEGPSTTSPHLASCRNFNSEA